MKKLSFLLVALCFSFTALVAQTGSIKGSLADSIYKEILSEATVTVLSAKDSAVISFVLSNPKGEFLISGLDSGSYRLTATYSGYATYTKFFKITRDSSTIDLGNIQMFKKDDLLTEVVVEAPPITVKKDTVEFRADAFRTRPNSTAEDVFKKIPGMQVDKDGNVKAQGEDITKVYVDGKEFFGTDPKLATKNITADMIESVQVFDDMSDQARFTRIDDGSRAKTINIKLKKDKRKGYFGRAMAARGTDNRYDGTISFNKFNGDQRISLLGGLNNLNKSNFSISDIVSTMGGGGNRGGGGGFGGGGGNFGGGGGNRGGGGGNFGFGGSNGATGITKAKNIGLNYTDKWGSKIDVTASYFFSESDRRTETDRVRQSFFSNDSSTVQTNRAVSNNYNQNHRFNLRMEWYIDSNNSILYTPNVVFQRSNSSSYDSSSTDAITAGKERYLRLNGVSQNGNSREGVNVSNNLMYRRKFDKLGRTLTVSVNNSIRNNDADGRVYAPQRFYNYDGSLERDTLQDRITNQKTKPTTTSASATYTEPVSNNSVIALSYEYSHDYSTSDGKGFDYNTASGDYDNINLLTTNYFENTNNINRAGVNYRFQKAKYNFQLGSNVQLTDRTNRSIRAQTGKDSTFSQSFTNFNPLANFTYNFSRSKTLRFNYNGNTSQPTIDQLQDVIVPDETNPLLFYTGNPNLKQAFEHRFR
ncbi:MAG: outer membrane beta-barrel protein, partial [Flavitalea sp.]